MSVEGRFLTDSLPSSPPPSSQGCPASCLPEMPNYPATQFITTPSMFSVATVPPLSPRRGRGGWGGGWGGWTSCQFENPPPGLTFVIFILLIFPPIPCECTQKGGCQLPPQCVQRYEEKKYSGRFNSGGAILAENTDRLLRLVAKVCRDVTVKSMRKTMTCGDKCPPALCRGFFFARGLSLV